MSAANRLSFIFALVIIATLIVPSPYSISPTSVKLQPSQFSKSSSSHFSLTQIHELSSVTQVSSLLSSIPVGGLSSLNVINSVDDFIKNDNVIPNAYASPFITDLELKVGDSNGVCKSMGGTFNTSTNTCTVNLNNSDLTLAVTNSIIIDSGVTWNITGGGFSGNGVDLSLTSTSGNIDNFGTISTSGNISFFAGVAIDTAGSGSIAGTLIANGGSGSVSLVASGGSLTVNKIIANTVSLQALSGISDAALNLINTSTINLDTPGAVNLSLSSPSTTVNAGILQALSQLILTSTGSLTLGTVNTSGNSIVTSTGGSITVNGTVNSTAGNISLTAGSINGNNGTVNSPNGNISLNTNSININSGAGLNIGGGTLTLNSGTTMTINDGGKLEILPSSVFNNAGTLIDAGNITIDPNSKASNSGTIKIECGGSVSGSVLGNQPINDCKTPPLLKLSPSSGEAGSSATASVTGFQSGETVQISYAGISVGTCLADSTGSCSSNITVPSTTSLGANTVTATGQTSALTATATFTVTASPIITLTLGSGSPGTQLTVNGNGFDPNAQVEIILTESSPEILSSVTTDSSGHFSSPIVIPAGSTAPFSATISAQETSNPSVTASAPFSVTVPTIPPPFATITLTTSPVLVGTPETLSASITDSGCPSCTPFSYAWSLVSRPAGSLASLSSTSVASPSFIPDLPGNNYQVSLVVTDSLGHSSAPTFLTISASLCGTCVPTVSPTASPNPAFINEPVTLDAIPGDAGCPACIPLFSYQWAIVSAPAGSSAALSDTTVQKPIITPDVPGSYQFSVVATDSVGTRSSTAFTTVTAEPLPTLSINDVSAPDGSSGTTSFIFTVSLLDASNHLTTSGQTVTVDFATSDGTAKAGIDYTATSGTLTFPPDTTTETITVSVNGDTTPKPDKTFVVNLSNPINAGISKDQGIGTIQNDDFPSISINDVSAPDGSFGTTPFVFTVSLSAPNFQDVTVDFATQDGTATAANNDYTSTNGILIFPAGTTTQTITVFVIGNTINDAAETFSVKLSNPTNAGISKTQGVGTILNDDPPPSLSINPATSVLEPSDGSSTTASFTVTLSAVSDQIVTVNYATSDDTAKSGTDYVANAGTLTFLPGDTTKMIPITILSDPFISPTETFIVNLSNPINAFITMGTGTGTIINPVSPSQATHDLISFINSLHLDHGITSSLDSKLNAALDSLNSNQDNTAKNQLKAFENYLQSQRQFEITQAIKNQMMTTVQNIINSIH